MKYIDIVKKNVHCYITWCVFVVFSLLMFAMSILSNWGLEINTLIILLIAIVSYTTFSEKVSVKTQSYIFAVATMANIYAYSFMRNELYPSIIVICSLAILLSIYMNWGLLVVVAVLSIIMVVLHVAVLNTVPFTTGEDKVLFIIRILAMLFSEVYLMFFVHRLYNVEKNLKASVEEARKAEHSKSDFLANMSHEIRTPMNAIVGMCELILREDISEEVRENCFNIQNSGRSLLAIINDILDFSKIESGKAELIEDEFNIGSTINDVINMAMTRKGEKKLEIIARIDPNIPKGLIGDEVRIKQVMINLMTNAVKFTNSGCVILRVSHTMHEYGINLNVSVKDTGIGISPENLEKLFTSFQQVDTKKNRAVEGTGLGLAISKQLITKMGGFINVSSTYGKGSEFKFVIPLKVSDEEAFIHIKDHSKINVAIYINPDKYNHPRIIRAYRNLINELGDKFNIGCELYSSFEELQNGLKENNYSHCIVSKEEYLECREEIDKLAKEYEVMVVQERMEAVSLPKSIKCIYKPFYALTVAAIFNNEKINLNLDHKSTATIGFKAPKARVLIVDDNITNLKVAEGLMKPYNMKIVTVMSGPEAIEAVKSKKYDIVFMDHMMPGMDGVEATKIIRGLEGEYFKNIPIIALTANAVNGVKEMFLNEGFNDFIAKPIELSLLARALKQWLPKELIVSSYIEGEEEMHSTTGTKEADEYVGKYISLNKGMIYTGGNKDVYLEVLSVYANKGRNYKASLDTHFKQEDWENYIIEVHALKSSSLSIGAEKLSLLAKSMEIAGKEENYDLIRDKHSDMIAMYEDVLNDAESYLRENGVLEIEIQDSGTNEELKEISMEELLDVIEQIKTACDNFDGDEIVAIASGMYQCSMNGNPMKPLFMPVKKFAAEFEYEQARDVAIKISEEIKS